MILFLYLRLLYLVWATCLWAALGRLTGQQRHWMRASQRADGLADRLQRTGDYGRARTWREIAVRLYSCALSQRMR